MAMKIVAAHGGFRIVEGDIEIERHGDKAVAEGRLAVLQKRAEKAATKKPASRDAAVDGASQPAEEPTEITAIRAALTGSVKEVLTRVESVDDPQVLAKWHSIEESGPGRK
ncbi:MAG: hypothetical protein AAFV53_31795, partial [Myxococcota bacterium]